MCVLKIILQPPAANLADGGREQEARQAQASWKSERRQRAEGVITAGIKSQNSLLGLAGMFFF